MTDLKKQHTRVLMLWLDCARDDGFYYPMLGPEISYEDLKAELATREHVPNKKEARVIRQNKAKERRNQ